MDEVLHAHALQQDFAIGLVRLGEDALGGGLIRDRWLRHLPATPEIQFMVLQENRWAVRAVEAPAPGTPFRPNLTHKEDEAVGEAEFGGDGKVRL